MIKKVIVSLIVIVVIMSAFIIESDATKVENSKIEVDMNSEIEYKINLKDKVVSIDLEIEYDEEKVEFKGVSTEKTEYNNLGNGRAIIVYVDETGEGTNSIGVKFTSKAITEDEITSEIKAVSINAYSLKQDKEYGNEDYDIENLKTEIKIKKIEEEGSINKDEESKKDIYENDDEGDKVGEETEENNDEIEKKDKETDNKKERKEHAEGIDKEEKTDTTQAKTVLPKTGIEVVGINIVAGIILLLVGLVIRMKKSKNIIPMIILGFIILGTSDCYGANEILIKKYKLVENFKNIIVVMPDEENRSIVRNEFEDKIKKELEVEKIENVEGKELTGQELVGTGNVVKAGEEKYGTVVYGDINGDGEINAKDIGRIVKEKVKGEKIEGLSRKAANLSNIGDKKDEKIDSEDINMLKGYILKNLEGEIVKELPEEQYVKVTGINLDKKEITIPIGETTNLIARVLPENATNKNVTYESSNVAVATVNNDGEIRGVGKGNVIITVTTEEGNYEAKCKVTVSDYIKKIILTPPTKLVYEYGESLDLTGGNIKVITASGAESVVELTNKEVEITGYNSEQEGTQTITVTYKGFTQTFDVLVEDNIQSIEISKIPTKTQYKYGESLDVTGGEITVTKSSGKTEVIEITPSMVTGFDSNEIKTQTLTVTYSGKEATFEVTVIEPDYSVLNFGADITGTTDSTNAIVEAINNYDQIYFPTGRYLISNPVVVEKSIKWIGKNAEIILDDSQYNAETIENPSTHILRFNNNIDLEGITFICQSNNDENYADGETATENYKYSRTAIKIVGGTEHKIKNCNVYISEPEDISARINGIWFQFDKITNNEENEENRTIVLENCYISNTTTGWDTGEGCFWVTGNAKSISAINCTFERNNVGDAVVFWGWPNAKNTNEESQKQKIESINIEDCIFNLTDEKNEMGAAALNFGNEANGTEYSTINIKNTKFNVGEGFRRPCIGMSSCSNATVYIEGCDFEKKDCTKLQNGNNDLFEYFRLFILGTDDIKLELNNCKVINPYTVTNLSERAYSNPKYLHILKNSSQMKFTGCKIQTRTHINSYNDSLFENCYFITTGYNPNNTTLSQISFNLGNVIGEEIGETNDDKKVILKNCSTQFKDCIFDCKTKISGNLSAENCTFNYPVNIRYKEETEEFRKNDNLKITNCKFGSQFNIETDYAIENICIQNNTFSNDIEYSIKDSDNTYKSKTFKDLNIEINSNGQKGNVNETGIIQEFVNENVKCKIQVEMLGEIFKSLAKQFYYEKQEMKDQELEIYADEDIVTIDSATLDLITRFKKSDLITTIKTNDEGFAELDNLYIGKYLVKEKINSNEYVLDKTENNIELIEKEDGEGSTEILKINKVLKKGNLQINLVTEDGETPITNRVVNIYNENNEHIFSGQTDNDGKIFVNGLKVGTYYISKTENTSQTETNEDRVMVEIKENNETICVNIVNN